MRDDVGKTTDDSTQRAGQLAHLWQWWTGHVHRLADWLSATDGDQQQGGLLSRLWCWWTGSLCSFTGWLFAADDSRQREGFLIRLWQWWTDRLGRLPDWLFAPDPEPLPRPPTREEFNNQAHEAKVQNVVEGDYECELQRVEGVITQVRAINDDASKTIRRVFYALVGTCLFCVVTLAGTPDKNLLGQEGTVKLLALHYEMGLQGFLLGGPVVLVALMTYLHIFVAQHRRIYVPKELEQPTLFNLEGWTPKLVVLLASYWMVPFTLTIFAWKAWPLPIGLALGYFTFGVTATSAILQFRRCPRTWRTWALPTLGVAFLIFYFGFFNITADRTLNLFKADLNSKDLRFLNLSGAYLSEANLQGANLGGTNLQGADLQGARLQKANLQGANLQGANLASANLQGARLENATLVKANLQRTNLNGAILLKANLQEANLQDSALRGAALQRSNLQRAKLEWVYLPQAVLSKANLQGANLQWANLAGANLAGADLAGANLAGANLGSLKGLSQKQLDNACGDEKTNLPSRTPPLTIKACKQAKAGSKQE